MAYDAIKMKDWQISEAAEKNMPSPEEWREKMGLEKDELMSYGRLARLDFLKIMKRLQKKKDGKYIDITAITPTPLGEGKSTTTMGLLEGMGKLGLNVGGCIRQPSGGPTMNIKGTAAGGGNALLIPMTEFSMGLTGDINNIMNAHNLAMVALTARMQHERNYNDEQLKRLTRMRRLDIDPTRVEMGWVIDFCAQSLRDIISEVNGTPFDLPEAESELVQGFFTEYSGLRFAMFYLAEYANLFVVSAVVVSLFLGGWSSPFGTFMSGPVWGIFWFVAKAYLFVFVQIWVRWTLPRLRVDQLMYVSWKVLTPWLFACLLAVGFILVI